MKVLKIIIGLLILVYSVLMLIKIGYDLFDGETPEGESIILAIHKLFGKTQLANGIILGVIIFFLNTSLIGLFMIIKVRKKKWTPKVDSDTLKSLFVQAGFGDKDAIERLHSVNEVQCSKCNKDVAFNISDITSGWVGCPNCHATWVQLDQSEAGLMQIIHIDPK